MVVSYEASDGPLLSTLVIEYIEKAGAIEPQIEGRIITVE